jgi:hypothetical protein
VRAVTTGGDPTAVAAAWQRRATGDGDARERMAAFLRR